MLFIRRKALGVLLTILIGGPLAAQDGEIIWIEYPEGGAVLGQGYDLLNGRVTYGRCVDFVPIQDPSQVISYKFEEVTSTTEVVSKTKISASGSMKMAILKASARLSFLSDETFSLDTSKFLLTAQVTNSAIFAAPTVDSKQGSRVALPTPSSGTQHASVTWTDALARTRVSAINDNTTIFQNVNLCGQGFVAAIVSGAAVDAFLTMSKSKAESLADIRGGLEADIASIFKVSGSFEQQQSSKEVQDSTSVSVFRYGGATGNVAFDLISLKESLKTLVTDAASYPKPVRIGILPYSSISTDLVQSIKADDFSDAISAYFLAKDVMQRVDQALMVLVDVPRQPTERREAGQRPIYFADDLNKYDTIYSRAQQHAARISKLISFCREDSARANDEHESERSTQNSVISRAFNLDEARVDARVLFGRSAPMSPSASAVGESAPIQLDEHTLNKLYNRSLEILQRSLPNINDATYADRLFERLNACRAPYNLSTGEGSYLSLASDYSVDLVRDELAVRPFYWAELGERYRDEISFAIEKIATVNAVPVSDLSRNQIVQAAAADFRKNHALYRASMMRRGICTADLAHPICRTDARWPESSQPNFDAMEFDAQQLLVEIGISR